MKKVAGVEVFGVFLEPGAADRLKAKHSLVVRIGRQVTEPDGLERYDWPTFTGQGKLLGIYYQQTAAQAAIGRYEATHSWSYLHRYALRFWLLLLVAILTVAYVHYHDAVGWIGSLAWAAIVCAGVGIVVWLVTSASETRKNFWEYDAREGIGEP